MTKWWSRREDEAEATPQLNNGAHIGWEKHAELQQDEEVENKGKIMEKKASENLKYWWKIEQFSRLKMLKTIILFPENWGRIAWKFKKIYAKGIKFQNFNLIKNFN